MFRMYTTFECMRMGTCHEFMHAAQCSYDRHQSVIPYPHLGLKVWTHTRCFVRMLLQERF